MSCPKTEQIAHSLPVEDDPPLAGEGEVVEHFRATTAPTDLSHGRKRRIEVEKSGPVSERKLLP